MQNKEFKNVVDVQVQMCKNILIAKGVEYSSEADKLHNFKQSAHLQQITQKQALAGKMAKHTVSIYDMIKSDEQYSIAQWDEKITDHLNYLLLLKAVVVEEANLAS